MSMELITDCRWNYGRECIEIRLSKPLRENCQVWKLLSVLKAQRVPTLKTPIKHVETTHYQYRYGPFGEVIRATGPMAKLNPFRFSTKYQDDETDFLYYGYRYYNPAQGRWIGRDPAGEDQGGANLYGFVGNDALNNADQVGLSMFDISLGGGFDFGGSDVNQMETDLNFMAGWGAGLKAQSISIKGHAANGLITMDNDTFLTTGATRTGGEDILDQNGTDLTALFQKVMAPGGCISLGGCETGRGANSVAKNFSLALPGIFVSGGSGLRQLGIPWTATAIGRKNYFYNGNIVDTAWGQW
jgi:RHS repeat-associated protein